MAGSTWSATAAPNPPEPVKQSPDSTLPSLAIRMNGVRSARSVSSSSAAAGENRSAKSRGSDPAAECSGPVAQYFRANTSGGTQTQRPSAYARALVSLVGCSANVTHCRRRHHRGRRGWPRLGGAFATGRAVGAAVVTTRVGAAVGGAFATGGAVGAAVVTTLVGAAVGGTFAT